MEVEPFSLNTQRHGTKTFSKICVIDNKNRNPDKLNFLLNSINQFIQINFLANAKIDKMEPHAFYEIDEEPNVTWGNRDRNEKELEIYLNDVWGFKPDQISFQKLDQKPSPNRLPGPSGPPQKGPQKPDKKPDSKDEKIRQLELRIRELEEKLRSQPNSPTHQNDQNELNRLKNELNRLKGTDNPQQSNKDKFPYGLVIGGGIVFGILLLLGIVLVVKKRK